MKHNTRMRSDWESIEKFIQPSSTVLDLGCGDGSLLELLRKNKNVQVRGVDIDQNNILSCIQKEIPVFQSNLDEGLSDYGDKTFDYVILSLTLQVVYEPRMLLKEIMRVGKKGIVSIPNFGYWISRIQLLIKGTSPVTEHLPYEWYNTPNIRTTTVADFINLCGEMNIRIEATAHTCLKGKKVPSCFATLLPNLFSEVSVFLLS
ncbi:MAG: methionine biosynthesis protein MetW [Candidatus Aureabacteria bacterium]|nr:methionine biosynthesis protein MetW [Candidatus Auribacterota bacterium]